MGEPSEEPLEKSSGEPFEEPFDLKTCEEVLAECSSGLGGLAVRVWVGARSAANLRF